MALIPQANAQAAQWEQQFGYQPQYEDQIAIATDSAFLIQHTDLKILQLLLEKIVDQNQKQLDGQYNIPEGATFWVPLTAAYYRNQGGGGGGMGLDTSLANTELNNLATAAQGAAAALYERGAKTENELLERFGFNTTPATVPTLEEHNKKLEEGQQVLDFLKQFGFAPTTGPNPAQPQSQPFTEEPYVLPPMIPGFPTLPSGSFEFKFPELERFFDWFKQLFISPDGVKGMDKGISGLGQTNSAPTSRINLNINSTTTLLLDGRMVAESVKAYLLDDLLRMTAGYGSSTRSIII